MPQLPYHVVDVFAEAPFAGNPLAVVLDAEALTTDQMQTLANEFQLSETTFPLRPTTDEAARGVDYRLRIFTPVNELPFAGHPSVGTAWLMARLGRVGPGTVVQACGAGDLPLDVPADGGPVELTGGEPTWTDPVDPADALAAVGLGPDDLSGEPVRSCGTGLGYVVLPTRPGRAGQVRAGHHPAASLGQRHLRRVVGRRDVDGPRPHVRRRPRHTGGPGDRVGRDGVRGVAGGVRAGPGGRRGPLHDPAGDRDGSPVPAVVPGRRQPAGVRPGSGSPVRCSR